MVFLKQKRRGVKAKTRGDKMDDVMEISVIILTNKSYTTFNRLCEYYLPLKVHLYIADASEKSSEINENNKLYYFHMPYETVVKRIMHVLELVKTEYVCIIRDTDFMSSEFLKQSVRNLKSNPSMIAVLGKKGFSENSAIGSAVYGYVMSKEKCVNSNEDSVNWGACLSLFYALVRADILKKYLKFDNGKQYLSLRAVLQNVKISEPTEIIVVNDIFSPPLLVIMDIAAVCNAQCPFCPRVYMPEERKKGFMTKELFEKCLVELKQHKVKDVRLYATSEPTLHPDFSYFITCLKDEGVRLSVSTNAAFLDKYCDSLLLVDDLQLSIDGWDRASYEKFRFPLKFDDIQKKVRDFYYYANKSDIRPHISAHLLLTKKTDIIQYLDCWGAYVDTIRISFLMGTTRFNGTRFVTEYPEGIKDDLYSFETKKDFVCSYPFDTLTIAFDGKIALCCADFSAELPLGNILDGIETAFQSPALQKIRHEFLSNNPKICINCNAFHRPLEQDVVDLRKRIDSLHHPHKDKLIISI